MKKGRKPLTEKIAIAVVVGLRTGQMAISYKRKGWEKPMTFIARDVEDAVKQSLKRQVLFGDRTLVVTAGMDVPGHASGETLYHTGEES